MAQVNSLRFIIIRGRVLILVCFALCAQPLVLSSRYVFCNVSSVLVTSTFIGSMYCTKRETLPKRSD